MGRRQRRQPVTVAGGHASAGAAVMKAVAEANHRAWPPIGKQRGHRVERSRGIMGR